MSELIIMRHAESVFGDQDIYSGIIDVPLSNKGISHIEKVSSKLLLDHIDIVFTSTLTRSLETALILLANSNLSKTPVKISKDQIGKIKTEYLPVIEVEELRERNYGILQELSKDEIAKRFDAATILSWRRSFNDAPPNGESLKQIVERVSKFYYDEIYPLLSSNKNILIVAHQNSIRALYYIINKISENNIDIVEFGNCATIKINFTDGTPVYTDILYTPPGNNINFIGIDNINKSAAVFISAAGKGTRMGSITSDCPKPLLTINNRPLIDYLTSYLKKSYDNIYVLYGYLDEKWNNFIKTNDNLMFIKDESISLIYSLIKTAKHIENDFIVVISGDMVFDYRIIDVALDRHILEGNDVSIALNNSVYNVWKQWNYVSNNGLLIDIELNPESVLTDRYFFIINKKTLVDYTENFNINMGEDKAMLKEYLPYNTGWSCLLKMLVDKKKYIMKCIYFNETLINVNGRAQLQAAELFFKT